MSAISPVDPAAAMRRVSRGSLAGLTAKTAALATGLFMIGGPLSSLVIWSVAERWNWPSSLPQVMGLRYWSRLLSGDFLVPLQRGLEIAVIVTTLALLFAVPLGYALARLRF